MIAASCIPKLNLCVVSLVFASLSPNNQRSTVWKATADSVGLQSSQGFHYLYDYDKSVLDAARKLRSKLYTTREPPGVSYKAPYRIQLSLI